MKWPWSRPEAPPLYLAKRAIYDLDDRQQAAQAGLVLSALTDQQWEALAAIADWLRLREVETAAGKVKTVEDVAFLAGRSEGMRRLLAKARDVVATRKRASLEDEAREAADVLLAKPRADEL